MKFKLEIDMNNAAFDKDFVGATGEIHSILSNLNYSIIDEMVYNKNFTPDRINLKDSNGNTVGWMKVIGKCKR